MKKRTRARLLQGHEPTGFPARGGGGRRRGLRAVPVRRSRPEAQPAEHRGHSDRRPGLRGHQFQPASSAGGLHAAHGRPGARGGVLHGGVHQRQRLLADPGGDHDRALPAALRHLHGGGGRFGPAPDRDDLSAVSEAGGLCLRSLRQMAPRADPRVQPGGARIRYVLRVPRARRARLLQTR